MDAREIVRARGGFWHGDYGMASCPVPGHGRGRGDLRPSLSIRGGEDGQVIVKCFAGCDPGDVISALKRGRTWSERRGVGYAKQAPVRAQRHRAKPDSAVLGRIDALWREARALQGTPGERYLAEARRVGLPQADSVRFHPRAPFSADGAWRIAGLVALVQASDGTPCGLQVTALKPDGSGKVPHKKTRHTFGAIRGGAVRLAPIEIGELAGALAVAEGVETALGFTRLSGYPCWAALGGNLAGFVCPPDVEELVIAADHDEAGLKSARALALRECRERFVEIRHPGAPGEDWADVAAQVRHG